MEQQRWQELVLLCWHCCAQGAVAGLAQSQFLLPVPVQHLLSKYTTAEWSRLGTHENCKSFSGISAAAGGLHHAKTGLGTVLTTFSGVGTMSHFPAKSVSQTAQLSFQGRGQLHGLLQNVSCLKKPSFHVGFCRGIFCRLVISVWFKLEICSTRLVRSWLYTFLESNALETCSVHKKLAQVTFCFTFLLHFSEEILTKQFTIFRMLMAVKLRQKRDLLLH